MLTGACLYLVNFKLRFQVIVIVGMDFHSTPCGHPRHNTRYNTMKPTSSDTNLWYPSSPTRKPGL